MKKTFSKENFHTSRPDGRYDRTLGFLYEQVRQKKQVLSLNNVQSPEEFPVWREKIRSKLRELLRMRTDLQLDFRLLGEEKRDGYRIFRYELYPEDFLAVPFLMLIPEDVIREKRRVPAVICNPGAGADLDSLAGEPGHYTHYPRRNRQAWWYARAGMIGIAVENPATAYNSEPDFPWWQSHIPCLRLLQELGRTYQGFITEQRLLLIEFLKQHPLVDPDRLGCSGMSLGCGGTLFVSVLSDDVRAVVYNDFVCSHMARLLSVTEFDADPLVWCNFIPGSYDWFDMQPDLHAALAPRHLLLVEGGSWKNCIEKIVRGYQLAGVPDRLSVQYYRKFRDPASRTHEDIDLTKTEGLTPQEFIDFSNVDSIQHGFHPEQVIPWIYRVFFNKDLTDPALLAELADAADEQPYVFNPSTETFSPPPENTGNSR